MNIGSPYLGGGLDKGTIESATAIDSFDGEELFDLEFNHSGGDSKKLPIGNGLSIEVKPSILRDGDTAQIDIVAPVSENMWWIDEKIRNTPPIIDTVIKWKPYAEIIAEEGGELIDSNIDVNAGLLNIFGRKSTSKIQLSGNYDQDDSKTYTFTVNKRGSVGITRVLPIIWEDTFGNTGKFDVGEGYIPGTPILFDSGLSVSFGDGQLYKDDHFNLSLIHI